MERMDKINLEIGFSPCPNDTFIFDALVNNKIDTENICFKPILVDVQTLNEWAIEGKLPVTKISYGVLPLLLDKYEVLNSGSALGWGVGPLLVVNNSDIIPADISKYTVAIPGQNTTAHLLFSHAFPHHNKKVFVRYNEVEDFVLGSSGKKERAGVIIHENRFTYQDKGLQKLVDLGAHWEHTVGTAIPLGGIVVRKDLEDSLKRKIDRLILKSIEYSYSQYPSLSEFIRCHAQEMDEAVMRQHIDLYVNENSKNLGVEGRKGILKLLEIYAAMNGSGTSKDLKIFSSE